MGPLKASAPSSTAASESARRRSWPGLRCGSETGRAALVAFTGPGGAWPSQLGPLDKRTSGDTEEWGYRESPLVPFPISNLVKVHQTGESSRINLVPPVSLLVGFPESKDAKGKIEEKEKNSEVRAKIIGLPLKKRGGRSTGGEGAWSWTPPGLPRRRPQADRKEKMGPWKEGRELHPAGD